MTENDDGQWYAQVELLNRRRCEESRVRELARLAYSDPDKARVNAIREGLYQPMLERMVEIHKRLVRFYNLKGKKNAAH